MKHLLLIFIALFLMLSCERSSQDNEFHAVLPPETQTGANTFGCMVKAHYFTQEMEHQVWGVIRKVWNLLR